MKFWARVYCFCFHRRYRMTWDMASYIVEAIDQAPTTYPTGTAGICLRCGRQWGSQC